MVDRWSLIVVGGLVGAVCGGIGSNEWGLAFGIAIGGLISAASDTAISNKRRKGG